MAELQDFLLVVENNKEEAIRIAGVTAESNDLELQDKRITLVEIVQSLGEYINDDDTNIRGKAVSYLTAILKALPDKFMSRQQLQVLVTFYCARIEDGGAIAGLRTLQLSERFTSEMTKDVFRALVLHALEFRKRTQSQRIQVLHLLNEMMAQHRSALKSMEDESLAGIVELVRGERDPRNLMIVFSLLRAVMIEWDISDHIETLFEAVYNYFPITFRTPPNDPYGVTAQDLKDRLQQCISSNSLFAPHAFPSLLDKLDSTSNNVKRDAMRALTACIESYDPGVVAPFSISIWSCLKFEILNAQENVLPEEALVVLRALAARLSIMPPANSHSSRLLQFLRPITKDCSEQLQEPQQKQAKPARQILRSLSAASPASFKIVTESVLQQLIELYRNINGVAKQRELLETFNTLIDSAIEVFGAWTSVNNDSNDAVPLLPFKDELTDIFGKALMGSAREELSFRLSALRGLLKLSTLRKFLQDSEINLFVQYFDDILLNEGLGPQDELRQVTVSALQKISMFKPQLIIDTTLPALLATLLDPTVREGEEYFGDYVPSLDSLARICIQKDVFSTLVRRLLSKLDVALALESESSSRYAGAILTAILYPMQRRTELNNDTNLEFYYDKIVRSLCRRAALDSLDKNSTTALNDPRNLDTLGTLCSIIIRSLPQASQDEACQNLYSLYTTKEDNFPTVFSSNDTTSQQMRSIILSTYILAALPKDIQSLPYADPNIPALLQKVLDLATSKQTDPLTQIFLVRHVALLANKFLPASDVQTASDILFSLLPPAAPTPSARTIRTIFWLSKALILRLAPTTDAIVTALLDLLDNPSPDFNTLAARGFSILLAPDQILSLQNGANIRLLAKQKVFSTLIPLISSRVTAINTSRLDGSPPPSENEGIKEAYLRALSGVLPTVRSSLISSKLSTIVPLLLQILDLNIPLEKGPIPDTRATNIKYATLETLAVIICENGIQAINELGYVEDLVTRLVESARFYQDGWKTGRYNPDLVRRQALDCLLLLAKSPMGQEGTEGGDNKLASAVSPLLPSKREVLRALVIMLDDPRREVRKAAVNARSAWLRNVEDKLDPEED
ncbi:hypothetical protein FQN57_005472 [Myotisia sp. PD_48]|nr:hypothetical protein FQN57_005472 [Myotisia sp. PD_48]